MKIITNIFLLICFIASLTFAQRVIRINNFSGGLQKEFESAFKANRSAENFWIAYSITRSDAREFVVGSWYFSNSNDLVTLGDIVRHDVPGNDLHAERNHRRKGININSGFSINLEGADKETAILIQYDRASKGIEDFKMIDICSMSRSIDLYGYPLIWIASNVDQAKSVDFLKGLFTSTHYDISRRQIIPAIGIHSDQKSATEFLKVQYDATSDGEMKKKTAFWLGFQENTEALNAVMAIVDSDAPMKVRKEAVSGLGFNMMPQSLDKLITIIKSDKDHEIRRQAVFGLGNKAVDRAEEALKGIVDNDPDIEIKKTAVYALSNMSHDAVPYLIKLAKSHHSIEVRKCAIYSLSNCDDERAVDALISLAGNK